MWMWLLLAFLPSTQVNGEYWLSTDETHILFSGDIEVLFGISTSNLSLRLQLFQNGTDGEKSIAIRDLPQSMRKGKIVFPCGTFQAAGQYVFKLLNAAQDEILTESNHVNVLWPEVAIHVPLMVETYSSNVIVQLYTDQLKCRPRVNYQIYVDLLYEGSVVDAWLKPTILTSKQLSDWMWNSSFDVTLECEFFDRAGNYTVHVRTDLKEASRISSSDTILVIWSHRYSLSVAKRSIQPCDGSLSVIYHYPRCILDQDRIRVYGKSSKGPLKYIRESRIISGKHATKLSCDIFQDDYQEYCFNFVSIARNGAVFDLKTHCIPTLVENLGFQASWNPWSSWSECSTSCGVGIQTRFRFCVSLSNDSNCIGKPVQTQICKQKSCPDENTEITTTEQPQLLEDCPCGCEKNATEKIVLRAVIRKCDSEVSYIMHAWPSGHVVVDVLSVTFPSDNYWLTIRDGKSPLGPVLALMEDSATSHSIHSITRTIRLEIHVSNSSSLQEVVIVFSVMQSEIPRKSLAMVRQSKKSVSISSNLSAVHVTIIMLATVLLSSTAVLILFHFCRYIRTKTSQNTHALDTPELLTSTSELSIKSPSMSPEDYLYNSFIFRSSTSLQPKLKWDKLPPKMDMVSTSSPVRRRSRPIIKSVQRESATPLTASVSELSTNGSDDGLEYDYYDYGCHQEPGSFFCPDPVLMGWPPFIPLPPQGIEEFGDYPLQNFTPSPEPS